MINNKAQEHFCAANQALAVAAQKAGEFMSAFALAFSESISGILEYFQELNPILLEASERWVALAQASPKLRRVRKKYMNRARKRVQKICQSQH